MRHDDRQHVEIVFPREVEIPLVVGGTAENRARAVFHKNEIGNVYRQGLAVNKWMAGPKPGVVADFLGLFDHCFRRAQPAAFLDEFS